MQPPLPQLSASHKELARLLWESFSTARTIEEADAACEAFKTAPDEVRRAILLAHGDLQQPGSNSPFGANPFV